MAKEKTPVATLEGNIIEHMRLMTDLKEQKRKHFHFDSKIWRAIQKSVGYDDDLVEHPKDYLIRSYRGSGRAVSLEDVWLHRPDYLVKSPHPPTEYPSVAMEIKVEYVHEDDAHGQDNPPSSTRVHSLEVPTELFAEFSQIKFDNWVKKVKAERDATQKEEDLKKFKELAQMYPHAVAEALGEISQ